MTPRGYSSNSGPECTRKEGCSPSTSVEGLPPRPPNNPETDWRDGGHWQAGAISLPLSLGLEINGTHPFPSSPNEQRRYEVQHTFMHCFLSPGTKVVHFYRPLCGGRSRTHFPSQSLTKPQMRHLEAFNAKSAQSKDVQNENLDFLRRSAVCLLLAVCSLFIKKPLKRLLTLKLLKAKMFGIKI